MAKNIIIEQATFSQKNIVITSPENDDAGYDIRITNEIFLAPKSRAAINVNFKWQPPSIPKWVQWLSKVTLGVRPVWLGRIAPRSGLAVKDGIDVLAGVIDQGYRGEFGIVLYNTSDEAKVFKAGDKIAQMLLMLVFQADIEKGLVNDTSRGNNGFGSTGK